ncbi:MAG: hypothetical protein Q9M94_06495 [Candidatus Gracilibacteria bacterium]|nr:hypothetical protein [Candidatus Gracilibacteria bacterium]MDQ7023767.1 hypothetical protein [Candidatus Gracilibacteria bacterium]
MDIEYKFNYRFNPKSNRLENYNYSENGGYFITICTKDRIKYFGEIIDGKMILNEYGEIVEKYYLEISEHFKNIVLDEFIIMPNHIHFVIILNNQDIVNKDVINKDAINGHLYSNSGEKKRGGITGNKNCMLYNGLGKIINWYKGRCSFEINKLGKEPYFAWQKNYFDRVIRNEDELQRIRKYIFENPLKWELEKDNEQGIFI